MARVAASRERGPATGRSLRLSLVFLIPILAACSGAVARADVDAHLSATAVQYDGVRRWPAGAELIVTVRGLSPSDSAAVFRAFSAWLSETGVPLTVRAAGAGEAANVRFGLTGRIDESVRHAGSGRTRLEWQGPWLVRAAVELSECNAYSLPVDAVERRRAIVHEVGHVLGLGHSPRFSSIMHRQSPGTGVDATDRATLATLYAVPASPAMPVVASATAPPDPR